MVNPVFDGIDGCMVVNVIVVLVDWPLLALANFRAGMTTSILVSKGLNTSRVTPLMISHCQHSVLFQLPAKLPQVFLLHAQ